MSGIPHGWREGTIGGVATLVRNGIFARRPTDDPVGVPILRISAVRDARLDLKAVKYVAGIDSATVSAFSIQSDDLLFTRYNGSRHLVGRCARVPEHDGPILHPDKLIRVVPDREVVDSRFLALYAESSAVRRFLEPRIKTTAGQSGITGNDVRQIPVRYPSLIEQRQIAEILEDHLSRLDHAESLLAVTQHRIASWRQALIDSIMWRSLPQSLNRGDQYDVRSALSIERDSVLNIRPANSNRVAAAADTDYLPHDVPWPVVSLEAVSDPVRLIRYGILMPKVREGGTVPYVEVKDLAGNTLHGKLLHLTSRELDEQFAGARLVPGDVVLAVRGSFERVAIVPESFRGANISRDVVRIAPLPSYDPEFIYYWLQTSWVRSYLRRHARGVAVKGVNVGTLRALPIPAVPRNAQQQVVGEIARQLPGAARLDVELDRSLRRSMLLKKALLNAAFNGQLSGRISDHDLVEELAGV